jgi:predicted esterase
MSRRVELIKGCGLSSILAVAATFTLAMVPELALGQLAEPPANPKPDARYVFYLHGVGVEMYGSKASENWRGTARSLEGKGFVVIGEERGNVNVPDYAKKISDQAKGLIAKGVPPENITVVGYSKGGLIALSVAAWTQEPRMNFVILAGCATEKQSDLRQRQLGAAPRYKGRMLSIFDAADKERGSCQALFDAAGADVRGSERRIETRLGHEAFAKVSAVWFDPTVEFISTAK